MGFKIVKNDISKIEADIIVNSANSTPAYIQGCDKAIYEAAGAQELLKERIQIGVIKPGEARLTNAYNLKAKFIVHTVGPTWIDGTCNEAEILKSCYENALKIAVEKEAHSIAFPLISTGVFNFPKDLALNVALSVFKNFFENREDTNDENDFFDISLVVFDDNAFQISKELSDGIDQFLNKKLKKEVLKRPQKTKKYSSSKEKKSEVLSYSSFDDDLDKKIRNVQKPFSDKLIDYMNKKGLDSPAVYKKAHIDRRTFSKIISKKTIPQKNTILAIGLALQLSLNEVKDLLASASYAFNPSDKFDLIIQYFFMQKKFDILKLDAVLHSYCGRTLIHD